MTTPPYEVAFVTHRRWGNLFSSYNCLYFKQLLLGKDEKGYFIWNVDTFRGYDEIVDYGIKTIEEARQIYLEYIWNMA